LKYRCQESVKIAPLHWRIWVFTYCFFLHVFFTSAIALSTPVWFPGVGAAHYNTLEEIARFGDALKKIAK